MDNTLTPVINNDNDDTAITDAVDVVVVGGGLAGLAAAAFAARGGADVLLLEKAQALGGRAATRTIEGFSFNLGPHALYTGSEGEQVLRDLAVPFSGRRPPVSGGLAFRGGRLHTLPSGLVSLLTTGLLTLSGKVELAGALSSLAKIDVAPLRDRSLREWTQSTFRDHGVREVVEALTRVTGYANDPSRASAGAAVAQLQRGLGKGVSYVDFGWQSLVDGLAESAKRAGVRIRSGQGARSVKVTHDGGYTVTCNGGGTIRAAAVVMAVAPAAAASLYQGPGSDALARALAALRPVKAACLDLALRRLPDPRVLFCLGIDRPLYFSVHSASAQLAPDGGALVHVAKYLPGSDVADGSEQLTPGHADPRTDEAELESFCELLQPGWRQQVIERRYLPAMTVVHALVEADAARPAAAVAGTEGLWLAGDWVGERGMLADAALDSARTAGTCAARYALGRHRDACAEAGQDSRVAV